jgi:hypothetical protein
MLPARSNTLASSGQEETSGKASTSAFISPNDIYNKQPPKWQANEIPATYGAAFYVLPNCDGSKLNQ